MQTQKQNTWNIAKPLLVMTTALLSIILVLHAATNKQVKKEDTCDSAACKKVKADILNAITVKLM